MRVFVTSDSVAGRSVVRGILEDHGHIVDEPRDIGAGALMATIDLQADAVVAVLLAGRPSRQRRAAVLVEIGVAVGRAMPTLILTKPGLQLPSLAGVPRIDADLKDTETLRLKVDLFLEGVRDRAPDRPLMPALSTSLPVSKVALSKLTGLELEETVGRLLQTAGSDFIQGEQVPGRDRSDFALYLQGHETEVGMVLVEVKSVRNSADSRRRLREAAAQLSTQVLRAHASLGLLVYDGPQVRTPSTPLVVAMNLSELTAQLENDALPVVLRRARNQAIHGM